MSGFLSLKFEHLKIVILFKIVMMVQQGKNLQQWSAFFLGHNSTMSQHGTIWHKAGTSKHAEKRFQTL
jgi:hypothetical protein